jgi:23S rRNA (guanine2445-N2)-methyltransferase / 23S rRNA (guanine2069-N7)-methyltransferase
MFQPWYATCPRGAEEVLAGELTGLGAKGVRPGRGGVRFTGEREVALRGCLALRTALRVLEPVGEFPAESSGELYAGARQLPWEELIAPGQTFAVSASGRAPGLTHTRFVEQRTKDAIVDRLREVRGDRPDVELRSPDVLAVVHLGEGHCDVSLDLAGELLSNRGYRVRTVEAPLREALAAATVLLSGWDGMTPLHDPLCGSGTIAIEAALIALRRAPNLRRNLSCERWPRTKGDRPLIARLREELSALEARGEVPTVLASDRDPEAVAAAAANARAAGVPVRVFESDARAIAPLSPPGYVVANVPYGERLAAGSRKQLKSFYHSLGEALGALRGHRLGLLSASDDFESAFGLRPKSRAILWNGPLRCALHRYER